MARIVANTLDINPGVLELGYIAVLEAAAERIKGSTPFAWTKKCDIFRTLGAVSARVF